MATSLDFLHAKTEANLGKLEVAIGLLRELGVSDELLAGKDRATILMLLCAAEEALRHAGRLG